MTTDENLLRQVTAYLDECEGTTILPESILDDIRAALPSTPQIRPRGLARFTFMSTPIRIGLAAAVLVVAAILGLNWLGTIQVGPQPDASDGPTPSADAGAITSLPQELRHPFLGPAKVVDGLQTSSVGDLDLTVIGVATYEGVLLSSVAITSDGSLRFETGVTNQCDEGDVGTYPYSLSPGGSILTIEEGTDDCAVRAGALPGTYQRSACVDPADWCLGVMEAGTYASHFIEPRLSGEWQPRHGAVMFTVPDGWAAYGDWPTTFGLTPRDEYERTQTDPSCYDCPGDRNLISILANPRAAAEDCADEPEPGVGAGIQDISTWLADHPGLVAGDAVDRTINGLNAITVEIEASATWTGTCDPDNPFVAVPIFAADGYHWSLTPGNRLQVTLIDLGDGNVVGVVVDAGVEADFDTFVAAAAPIIESFEFPEP